MINFQLPEASTLLAQTPYPLRHLVQQLPENWLHANEGEGTFSPFDVVGHLVHGEQADWIQRTRIILEHGESRAFEPFDRFAMYEASRGKNIDQLLS